MNWNNYLKIISKNNKFYIFDAITNNIYQVDDLESLESISIDDLGHKSDRRTDVLKHESMQHYDNDKNAKTLIIEITELCNMRCIYCVFDEKNTSERNHSSKTIDKNIAKKSILDFYNRSDKEEAYIVYYGGEPLLKFDLIKKLTNYAKLISKEKIKFSITTNGTLLKDDILDFLIKNDFIITVSIDGPEHIHNKNRTFKNELGTYKKIKENLYKIKLENREFFEKNIEYNCTISNIEDIDDLNNFFKESDIFKYEKVRFSPVIEKSDEINKFILNEINDINIKYPIQDSFIGDIFRKISHRLTDEEAGDRKKVCLPFMNRTYVRTNGEVQFCERIQSFMITDGVDLARKSKSIFDEFFLIKNEYCSRCFAYNFCELCIASFIHESKVDLDKIQSKCENYRMQVVIAMNMYINSMESM